MKKQYLSVFTFCISVLINYCASAQKIDTHDTSYYKTFPHSLTPRFYFSRKYTDLTFQSADGSKDLQYRANTKLNMGIGATYNNLTLNLALGFGFLNNNIEEKGKSKSLDLQLHLYPNGWAADLLLIHYKGFYAYPKGYAADNAGLYYYRPDIKLNKVGITAYRVANAKRFSYRAAMVQNEWQKKSAGSLLYGGGIYYAAFKGDSNVIPPKVAASFSQAGINDFHFISLGPGIGYAYTLVAAQHLFLMGSLIANANVNFATDENNNVKNNKTSFEPAAVYKAAAGYNGNVWDVSINWAGNALLIKEANVSKANFLTTGNFRVILAKKIMLKK